MNENPFQDREYGTEDLRRIGKSRDTFRKLVDLENGYVLEN